MALKTNDTSFVKLQALLDAPVTIEWNERFNILSRRCLVSRN